MNCEGVREAIAEAWGTGGAPSGAVLRHLAACDACVREARLIGAILNDTARLSVPDPGPRYWGTFLPRLRSRIGRERAAEGRARAAGGPAWLPARTAWLAPGAAAAIMILAAAIGFRPGGLPAGAAGGAEAEMAALRARVDAGIRASGAEVSLAIGGLLPAAEADSIETLDAAVDPDAALEALDDVTSILSPAARAGWPDITEMIEGLSKDQARALLSELDAPERGSLRGPLEEQAG